MPTIQVDCPAGAVPGGVAFNTNVVNNNVLVIRLVVKKTSFIFNYGPYTLKDNDNGKKICTINLSPDTVATLPEKIALMDSVGNKVPYCRVHLRCISTQDPRRLQIGDVFFDSKTNL